MNQNHNSIRTARYCIGELVRHRVYPFRGAIFDVDPEFDNDEEWWLSIPEDVDTDWVRGGIPSRQLVRDIEYKSCLDRRN